MEAISALKLPFIDDLNSPTEPPFGCGRPGFTIDEHSRRHSVNRAFLPIELVQKRANLHVCTSTSVDAFHVTRSEDGTCKVDNVSLISSVGKERTIRIGKELVLSSGPLGNPEILMRR